MADQDLALEAVTQRRLGDCAQRGGGRVERLVDVEVEVPATVRGEPDEAVEPLGETGGQCR